jgi:hypothetical protein
VCSGQRHAGEDNASTNNVTHTFSNRLKGNGTALQRVPSVAKVLNQNEVVRPGQIAWARSNKCVTLFPGTGQRWSIFAS